LHPNQISHEQARGDQQRQALSAQVSMFVGYDLAAALQSDLPYEQATDD